MVALTAVLAAVAVALAWPPRLRARRGPRHGRLLARVAATPRPARSVGDEAAWIESLVAELAGGRDPSSALLAASTSRTLVPEAVSVAAAGGDVVQALRASARSPLLRAVASCWEVAHGSGAGLAAALATLADAARDDERLRRELRAGVAEPRATALVLAALPVLGLALGAALGAEPLAWLLGSTIGLAVLGAGLALELLGAWWSWRITASLEAGL